MLSLYPRAQHGQRQALMLDAINACAKLRHLGIAVHAAHCHTGTPRICAAIPAGIEIYASGIEISRPTGACP